MSVSERYQQRWSQSDIQRVEKFNMSDGDNHLPLTGQSVDTPTWYVYERLIHILEGDIDFDFNDFTDDELGRVDWQEIKIVIQKMKGEEPESYDESVNELRNIANRGNVGGFLMDNFGHDFGILR